MQLLTARGVVQQVLLVVVCASSARAVSIVNCAIFAISLGFFHYTPRRPRHRAKKDAGPKARRPGFPKLIRPVLASKRMRWTRRFSGSAVVSVYSAPASCPSRA